MSTPVFLDRDSREPLYRQVRRAVTHLIELGHYGGQVWVPPSRAMAKDLGVSRNTVNLAYQELIAEGYLVSAPRSGIRVNVEVKGMVADAPRSVPPTIDWGSRFKNRFAAEAIERINDWDKYPYPFITGQFDVHMFPRGSLLRSFRRAMQQNNLVSSLQDWFQDDDPYFVDVICRRILPARGIEASPSEILVTLGSQQGLHLLYDTLVDRSSTVALEDPGYIDGRLIVQRTGALIKYLPVDRDGVIPPTSLAGVDLLYTTPSHQHPMNVTLSLARRREILEKASRSGTLVIEDDYDCEFQYIGSPSPALRALDRSGQVVYLGTFSKFLAPGLRLGYLIADRSLVEELRHRRRYMYRHPPGQIQRSVAYMIDSGDYSSYLRQYRQELHKRWEIMNKAADRNLPWEIAHPRGGLCLWTEGPPNLNLNAILGTLRNRGILLYRTDLHFSMDRRHSNCLRIGFGAVPTEAIENGMAELGRAVVEHLS